MNPGQASRADAATRETRNVTPFFPGGVVPPFDRMEAARPGSPSPAEQMADLMALADGWNFRLLV